MKINEAFSKINEAFSKINSANGLKMMSIRSICQRMIRMHILKHKQMIN